MTIVLFSKSYVCYFLRYFPVAADAPHLMPHFHFSNGAGDKYNEIYNIKYALVNYSSILLHILYLVKMSLSFPNLPIPIEHLTIIGRNAEAKLCTCGVYGKYTDLQPMSRMPLSRTMAKHVPPLRHLVCSISAASHSCLCEKNVVVLCSMNGVGARVGGGGSCCTVRRKQPSEAASSVHTQIPSQSEKH